MQITRKIKWMLVFGLGLLATLPLYTTINPNDEQAKAELLSECNGYLAWQSELRINPMSDVEAFIRGVRARAANKAPPMKMSFDELGKLAQEVEFEAHKKRLGDNLKSSEEFLAGVATRPGVRCVDDMLLYYEVVKEGVGPVLDDVKGSYYFNYMARLPDDRVLYDTKESGCQQVALDSVIPGFAKGVMGMRQGERRLLYIHPSLGFRSMHWTVPPNMVLVMDVEFGGEAK